jgi:hypothetical protein
MTCYGKRVTYENKNCKFQVKSNEIEVCLLCLLRYFESEKYHETFARE